MLLADNINIWFTKLPITQKSLFEWAAFIILQVVSF